MNATDNTSCRPRSPRSPRLLHRGLLLAALCLCAQGCLGEYEANYEGEPSSDFHAPAASAPLKLPDDQIARATTAKVLVKRQSEPKQGAPFTPANHVKVTFEWLELQQGLNERGQPNKPIVVEQYTATTDASGLATAPEVRVPKVFSRYALRAVVDEHGMKHFSKPLLLEADGTLAGNLELMMVSGDLSHILGGALITTANIPERMEQHPASYGYVKFNQVLELRVDQHLIYNTGSATRPEHSRGVPFEVPLSASSISAQVMAMGGGQMRDGADFGVVEVTDSTIYYKGLIYPEGDSFPQIRLMVQFYLQADGDALVFEQPLQQYWDDARFAFNQETDLPEHPVLAITLDAPQFSELDDKAQAGIMEGKKVKVARKPKQPLMPGDTLRVVIGGLPYPTPALPWYVLSACGVIAVLGAGLAAREVVAAKRRRSLAAVADPAILRDLDAEIEALYIGLATLRADLAAGEASPKAAAQEEERLKVRLVALLQHREAITSPPSAPPTSSPTSSPPPNPSQAPA
jgi:hypothetical protein